jgi:hypothetical protein
MRLAKCLHGLGAIGVEVLAVLILGWILSVSHPAQGVTATDACLTSPAVSADSREMFAADQLKRSADGLFEQLASHLSDVFTILDDT